MDLNTEFILYADVLSTKVFYSNILAQELKNQQYTLTILLKDFSSKNKYFKTGMKIAVSGKRCVQANTHVYKV